MNCFRVAAIAICCHQLWTNVAIAQLVVEQQRTDIPALVRVTPRACQIGQKATLTFEGDRFDDITSIANQAGIRLSKVVSRETKKAVVEVEVSADARPGCYPVFLLCKSGLSNPKMIRVDDVAQIAEPTKKEAQAVKVDLPCGITGKLTPAELDSYSFEVPAGASLVFDLLASRLGTTVEGELVLFDDSGRQLKRAYLPSPSLGSDVRIAYEFEHSGRYTIQVSDRTYQGGENSQYYLRIAEQAFAELVFPLGGQLGRSTEFTLSGGSLTEPMKQSLDLRADETHRVFRPNFETELGRVVSPILIATGRFPEVIESSDNDDVAHAEPVTMPVTINGRIERAGDRDYFKFTVAKDQKFTVRVSALALGSPMDPVLSIIGPDGKVQATVDDRNTPNAQPPAIRRSTPSPTHDDPAVTHTAKTAGEFCICIRDRFDHGGIGHAYRVELLDKPEDFELIVQPGRVIAAKGQKQKKQNRNQVVTTFQGEGTGSLSIDRGGRGSIVVKAIRHEYTGPISLSVVGLPSGLTADSATIASGENETTLDLNADFEAATNFGFVQIVGTSSDVQPEIRRQARHAVFLSAATGTVVDHDFPTVAVAISDRGAELALRANVELHLPPGGKGVIPVIIRRREGYIGEVTISAARLPAGFAMDSVTIPADKSEANVEVRVAGVAESGLRMLQLQASMKRPVPKADPKKKPKKDAPKPEPLLAFTYVKIDIVPLVVAELSNQRLDVSRGKQESLQLTIQKNGTAPDSITLKTSRLPKGVTLTPTSIPVGAEAVELTIAAAENAAASPIRRIIQITPEIVVNGKTIELPKLRLALKVNRK